MTNKEFLLKLVEAKTPIWLNWRDEHTVILEDLDDAFSKSKVTFDDNGNAISIKEVFERKNKETNKYELIEGEEVLEEENGTN